MCWLVMIEIIDCKYFTANWPSLCRYLIAFRLLWVPVNTSIFDNLLSLFFLLTDGLKASLKHWDPMMTYWGSSLPIIAIWSCFQLFIYVEYLISLLDWHCGWVYFLCSVVFLRHMRLSCDSSKKFPSCKYLPIESSTQFVLKLWGSVNEFKCYLH